MVRRVSNKMDAFATMTQWERRTYEQWLAQRMAILALLDARFRAEHRQVAWGKLMYVGVVEP
jgi:hypothetical protein